METYLPHLPVLQNRAQAVELDVVETTGIVQSLVCSKNRHVDDPSRVISSVVKLDERQSSAATKVDSFEIDGHDIDAVERLEALV